VSAQGHTRRVAFVGARPPRDVDGPDAPRFFAKLVEVARAAVHEELRAGGRFTLVSGGAKGIDRIVELVAQELNLSRIIICPEYIGDQRSDAGAPLRRNLLIVATAGTMHAFPAPWSRGTHHAVLEMRKAGKLATVHGLGKRATPPA
jgi:hypothetical protein